MPNRLLVARLTPELHRFLDEGAKVNAVQRGQAVEYAIRAWKHLGYLHPKEFQQVAAPGPSPRAKIRS